MSRPANDDKKRIARELYVISGLSLKATAIKAGVSERTLLDWRKADGWDEARELSGFDQSLLSENLHSLAHVASRKLKDLIEKGVVDSKQINAMRQLIDAISRSKKVEKDDDAEKPKKAGDASLHAKVLQRMGLA